MLSQKNKFWQAIVERDTNFENVFVYGVKTTKIYCRTRCASRRPKRENIIYFSDPMEAESNGFRACKRCLPEQLVNPQAKIIEDIRRYIETHSEEAITLDELSKQFGLSAYHLQRTFKKIVGMSPKDYLDMFRMNNFKQQLNKQQGVTTAAFEAGYGSSSRLYEKTNAALGMTPGTYAKGGDGTTIFYDVVKTSLGQALIAGTQKGICAIKFGDDKQSLVGDLKEQFASGNLMRDPEFIRLWAALLNQFLDGEANNFDVPLDLKGTMFQYKVWKYLQSVPRGATRTYAEVARAIGQPEAVRAVANACAANPVAIAIPCHRIVRTDGGLGGYRWGLQRKERLLKQEGAKSSSCP